MRALSLCIISMTSLALAGCQTNGETKVAKLPSDKDAVVATSPYLLTTPDRDLLALGRGMSKGSVDIYEPGVSQLDVPTIAAFTPRVSPIPENHGIVVRDPDVTVYSLDATAAVGAAPTALTPMPDEVVPGARQYAGNLMPTDAKGSSLPGLQAPTAANAGYISPFSPDGNIR